MNFAFYRQMIRENSHADKPRGCLPSVGWSRGYGNGFARCNVEPFRSRSWIGPTLTLTRSRMHPCISPGGILHRASVDACIHIAYQRRLRSLSKMDAIPGAYRAFRPRLVPRSSTVGTCMYAYVYIDQVQPNIVF